MPGTAQAWLEALTDGVRWDMARDADRVRRGFVILAKTVRRWPSPAEFIDCLPKFEAVKLCYEAKPVTPEKAAENIAKLKSMLGGVVTEAPFAKYERERKARALDAVEAELKSHYAGKSSGGAA